MCKGIKLLFGNIPDFDHKEYYLKCARSRTYNKHIMASKNYCFENIKPLFIEHKIMNLENLHMYHTSYTFMELFNSKLLNLMSLSPLKIVSDNALKIKNFV